MTAQEEEGKERREKERKEACQLFTLPYLLYGVNATASPLHLASLGSPSLLLIRLSPSRAHNVLSLSLSSTFLLKPSFPLLASLLAPLATTVYTVSSFSFHPLDPLFFLYRYHHLFLLFPLIFFSSSLPLPHLTCYTLPFSSSIFLLLLPLHYSSSLARQPCAPSLPRQFSCNHPHRTFSSTVRV